MFLTGFIIGYAIPLFLLCIFLMLVGEWLEPDNHNNKTVKTKKLKG